MDEFDALNERVGKLEVELSELRKQVSKLSRLLTEERNGKKRPREALRQKRRIVVGPSELIQLPQVKPSKPRPGDPQCEQ